MSEVRTILIVDDHSILHASITASVLAGARLLAATNSPHLLVPNAQSHLSQLFLGGSRCIVTEALVESTTFRVICASNAAAAESVLCEHRVDIVLLDLYLGTDQIWPAVELAELAKAKNASVCVLTADESTTSVALLHSAGVRGFLNKSSGSIALAIGWLLDGNTLFPTSLLDGAEALRKQADFIADVNHNEVLLDLLHKLPQKTTAEKVGKSQGWVSNKGEEAMLAFGVSDRAELLRRFLLAKMPSDYRLAILDALTRDSQTLEEVAKRHSHNPATLRQKAAEYYAAIKVGSREEARQLLQKHGL